MHLKHIANGRRPGWNPFCGTKNWIVLKHTCTAGRITLSNRGAGDSSVGTEGLQIQAVAIVRIEVCFNTHIRKSVFWKRG